MSDKYITCTTLNFEFDECVFSQSVTHTTNSVDPSLGATVASYPANFPWTTVTKVDVESAESEILKRVHFLTYIASLTDPSDIKVLQYTL